MGSHLRFIILIATLQIATLSWAQTSVTVDRSGNVQNATPTNFPTGKLKYNGLTLAASGANSDITSLQSGVGLTSPKITTSLFDTNGNTLLGVTATGSAVNYLTLANSATSTIGGTISAAGTGTNLDIVFAPKGSGQVKLPVGSPGGGIPGISFTGTNVGFALNGGNIGFMQGGNTPRMSYSSSSLEMYPSFLLTWSSVNDTTSTADTGLARNAAGVVEVNNGTAGTFRDLKARYYYTSVTNDASIAGAIGEYVSASVVQGSATALTTATPKTVTSISLTAGDWDVTGIGALTGASTGTVFDVAVGTTTNSFTGTVLGDTRAQTPTVSLTGADATLMIPAVRVSINATTTYYLIVSETFTVGTPSAYGRISARRVR